MFMFIYILCTGTQDSENIAAIDNAIYNMEPPPSKVLYIW